MPDEHEQFHENREEDSLQLYGQYLALLKLDEGEGPHWRGQTLKVPAEKGQGHLVEGRLPYKRT